MEQERHRNQEGAIHQEWKERPSREDRKARYVEGPTLAGLDLGRCGRRRSLQEKVRPAKLRILAEIENDKTDKSSELLVCPRVLRQEIPRNAVQACTDSPVRVLVSLELNGG